MAGLDLRIVRAGIEVNGVFKIYEGIAISAIGTKFGNANPNECEITLSNLDRATQDYILSETSPYNLNRTPKRVRLDAGRRSYGVSTIFSGVVFSSRPTQPPDIAVVLRCLTNSFLGGNVIATNQTGSAQISVIAKQVADQNGLDLNFQATDRTISNYQYSGSSNNQIQDLNDMGNINAYVDDNTLVVKDRDVALSTPGKIVSLDTGMIGIPEITEQGVTVKYLLDNQTVLGGSITIKSDIYPAANGTYQIYKLTFQVSNRDVPFYYIAECRRLP